VQALEFGRKLKKSLKSLKIPKVLEAPSPETSSSLCVEEAPSLA